MCRRERLKEHFSPRDLVVLSANPLLIEPTHYTGQPGYVTDTEDSPTIDDESVKKLKGDPDLLLTPDVDQVSMQKEEL
jgi:collagen beta-1,O-galactosyltransferase